MPFTRRSFIRHSAITVAGTGILAAVPMELLAKLRKNTSSNNTINVALIGCKGMGWSNLTSMLKNPEVKCVALCDIDNTVLNQRLQDLQKINLKPVVYNDYRKLLTDKSIDAVIIATPDHWHCLQW